MLTLDPNEILVSEDRKRKEFGEVGELSESIKKLGLLQPLVIERTEKGFELRAGERRLRAILLLKWKEVHCVLLSELSPLQRKEIELEENTRRKNLTWIEEVTLLQEIVKLKKEENPSYSVEKDAELRSSSKKQSTQIGIDLALAKAIESYPELRKIDTKIDAYRKAKRLDEIKMRSLEILISPSLLPKDACFSTPSISFFNKDCLLGIKELPDNSIDLIITDFPFGVDLHERHDPSKTWTEVYEDKPEHLLEKLVPTLASEFHRVLKEGCHFYIFFPTKFHEHFTSHFSAFFTIPVVPHIWKKRIGGTSYSPYTIYTPNYEMVLYGWKGKEARKLKSPGYCVLNFDNVKVKTHPAEKPIDLLSYLIDQSSLEGEVVLDTFCGSGSIFEACKKMNRKVIAFEMSKTWFELAVLRVSKT